ncbi:MAG: disulfide oxidoreductase [Acidimicrobiales bacterium]
MQPPAVQVIASVLAIAAACGAVALVVVRIVAPRRLRALRPFALWFAWAVAVAATAGSLYFSEVAHYVPCRLCWFQRIAMYPLAVLLGIAALRRDAGVWRYAVAFPAAGAAVSGYHYLIERGVLTEGGACEIANPCNLIWFERFGFVTLPLMALAGFVAIGTTLLVLVRPADRENPA